MTAAIGWRSSPFPAPSADRIAQTLADALLDRVEHCPDAIGVIDGDRRYGLADFAARVGGLAEQLRAADLPAGPIAAIQPMGVDMVAAWFACAAAGRMLVILDPQNPPERNCALATLAGARVLLHDGTAAAIPDGDAMRCIVPDGRTAKLMRGAGLATGAPMMIFPTSGSTGIPKLIVYSAETMQAKVQASIAVMGVEAGQTVLIAGAHGNFGFVHHALTFLLAGGTLCLFDLPNAGLSALARTIVGQHVDHLRFTPSLFRLAAQLPEMAVAFRSLRGLRFSGEPLLWSDVAAARALIDTGCRLQNVYGSTESAIFLWTDDGEAECAAGPAPIGDIYPLWDFTVLDDEGAASIEGHLIVRSRYQALGDWQGGAADPARFPIDPDGDGHRLYETGDVVRCGLDGRLTMLGRSDRMMKLNGQRVSLAEVEAHLKAMPGCTMAAAIVAGPTMAAFVVGSGVIALPDDPRHWLSARLPRHMVPGRIRIIDRLPLLPGGKVDHHALLRLLPADDPDAGPPDLRLALIHDLWARALGRPDSMFGIDRDFFDLGGDSLQFLNLQLMIERAMGRSIDRDAFLDQPTLRQLASQLGLAEASAVRERPVDGMPRFRLVRGASGISRGTVVVMPGRGGEAMVDPWISVNALPDHEIWACDVGWPTGHMLQRRRWIATAEAIAMALTSPGGPRPDILIGFSIGGYIAWLVDRLLAATSQRPRSLICLDPAPMHRRRPYRDRRLRRLLAQTRHAAPATMVLIRRATCAPVLSPEVAQPGWTDADGRIVAIDIRTIDHADMISGAVLTACLPHLDAFLHRPPSSVPDRPPVTLTVDTDSGRMYEMMAQPHRTTPAQIEAMTARLTRSGSYMSLMGALYLVVALGDRDCVRRVIGEIQPIFPNSMTTRLANRLTRHANWIGARPDRRRPLSMNTPSSIRHALAIRQDMFGDAEAARASPVAYRWHLAMAFTEARMHNLRYRVRSLKVRAARRFGW